MLCSNATAATTTMVATNNPRSTGLVKYTPIPTRRVSGARRFSGGSDSGRRPSVSPKATSDMIAAACATRPRALPLSLSTPARRPPSAGPKMKPMPKAEPSRPSALGRVASVVMSVV